MSAMERLDGKTMHWDVANSSVKKGESFEGINFFISLINFV